MIKDVNSRFVHYFVSTKIRQILLSYELVEHDFFLLVFCSYKNELLLV